MAEPAWLVSIHDLMPETMPAVREVTKLLDENHLSPLTLLVVPGYNWSAAELNWLRARQRRGDRLAGHGWSHRADAPRNLYDKLHRKYFSRGVAEHLALDAAGIESLIRQCHAWFGAHELEPPTLYVPPAWAMGTIARSRLRDMPFRLYESLGGIYDAQTNRFRVLPLVGFEADTAPRAVALRASNLANRALARVTGRLRVSIHPHDLKLELGDELRRFLQRPARCLDYA